MPDRLSNSETSEEPTVETKTTPALTTSEKILLQLAVMESYGLHHHKEHSEHTTNTKSMNWVDHGAAKAFQELLDELNLSPDDIREVEHIKALVRAQKIAEAKEHCHNLLSKKFAVEKSLKSDDGVPDDK